MEPQDFDSAVKAVATLKDPIRHKLYRLVGERAHPVSRDEAAEAGGVPRSVAAFHLDRLAEAGLLDVEFRRLGDRQGPGAGRPSKLYRRPDRDFAVSLPERRYDLAGKLLARAVRDAIDGGLSVAKAVERRAVEAGRLFGQDVLRRARPPGRQREATAATISDALSECGFEPRRDESDIVLGNCPFRALAEENTELVCGMNLGFIRGLLAGLGSPAVEARLDPQPGMCCVRLSVA
jgi:predicted ArsR family transcriptional regulator